MTLELFNQILMIFLLAAVGFIARKRNIITAQLQFGLSAIVLNIALPCSIIASANKPIDSQSTSSIIIILVGAVIYFAFSILLMTIITKLMRLPKKQAAITSLLVIFSNAAFIGYPVVSIFLPENGTFFNSFYLPVFNILFFTYAISKTAGNTKLAPKAIFGNINNIASVVMVVFYLLQFKLPVAVQSTLEILGGLNTPLSMLVIGSMLATIPLRQLFTTPSLYMVAFLRLLLLPTLAFAVLKAFGISGAPATVLLITSGLPAGSMTVMQAEKDQCDPEFATKGVLLTTLLFFATVPYLAFLQGLL